MKEWEKIAIIIMIPCIYIIRYEKKYFPDFLDNSKIILTFAIDFLKATFSSVKRFPSNQTFS